MRQPMSRRPQEAECLVCSCPNGGKRRVWVRRIERELCDGPAVYRYHDDDGLSGIEGGMRERGEDDR